MTASEGKSTSHSHGKICEDEEMRRADRLYQWVFAWMGIATFAAAVLIVAIFVRAWPEL